MHAHVMSLSELTTHPVCVAQGLLTRNPRDRMSAAQALDHPWVREGGEASEEPLDSTLVSAPGMCCMPGASASSLV